MQLAALRSLLPTQSVTAIDLNLSVLLNNKKSNEGHYHRKDDNYICFSVLDYKVLFNEEANRLYSAKLIDYCTLGYSKQTYLFNEIHGFV